MDQTDDRRCYRSCRAGSVGHGARIYKGAARTRAGGRCTAGRRRSQSGRARAENRARGALRLRGQWTSLIRRAPTSELPADILEGIGAICIEWTLLERELSLLGPMPPRAGTKQGNVAARSPSAAAHLAMIRQFMSTENLTVREIDLDLLARSLGSLESLRDQIAHGVFLRGPDNEIFLQSSSGNWKQDPRRPRVARRIKPKGIPIEAENLKGLARLIAACTALLHQLGLEIERGRGASHKKVRQQSDQGRPPVDPNASAERNEANERTGAALQPLLTMPPGLRTSLRPTPRKSRFRD